MQVFSDAWIATILLGGIQPVPGAGPLDSGQVILYQNNIVLSPDLVVGDFLAATFDGYAAEVAPAFNIATLLEFSDGSKGFDCATCNFVCTGSTTPNTIYGYAWLNGAGTEWFIAEAFEAPIPIAEAGNFITLIPRVAIFPQA